MTPFDRQEPRYRLAGIRYGDTLRSIALRELGDATRWHELVWLNELKPPYLTNDPASASSSVLAAGGRIKVPAVAGLSSGEFDAKRLYAVDAVLRRKSLQVTPGGDLEVVAGVDNLRQQITHRLLTPPGQARLHPDYGCYIWRLVGTVNGPVAGLLGADYIKSALLADYRIRETRKVRSEVSGDVVRASAVAVAIDGSEIPINLTE